MASKITVQIAVESILNMPHAFNRKDVEIVLADAIAAGVDEFYVGPLRGLIPGMSEY